jgi:catechol 2,3-dioxygenase-like lactoylglutathione lyase family enzyme
LLFHPEIARDPAGRADTSAGDKFVLGWASHQEPPMLSGLNHANISTAKLKETVDFFTNILGMRVGPRPAFDFGGAWLYLGDQAVLHLVERPARDPDGALDHVSFTVADLAAELHRLDSLGVPYRWSEIPSGFGKQAFVKDPNGVTIELTEVGKR